MQDCCLFAPALWQFAFGALKANCRSRMREPRKCSKTEQIPRQWPPTTRLTKKCEFDLASFGMIGLQTAYSILRQEFSDEDCVRLLGVQPRQVLGLDSPTIDVDAEVNYTLFDPEVKWHFTESEVASKSKNSPLLGREFSGKAIGVLRGKHSVFF